MMIEKYLVLNKYLLSLFGVNDFRDFTIRMFKPRFRYTNKIVRLLTRISASREVILNSPLIPKWEVALRQEAIIHSAHSSTSIEGNRLSLEQVNNLAQPQTVFLSR